MALKRRQLGACACPCAQWEATGEVWEWEDRSEFAC